MLDWDDLRYALAIAKHGGLAGAARALGADHSTVFRHLNALEAELGASLFERLPTGYRLTAAGERLIEAAERIETEVIALDRELTGRDTRLTGALRVTCSETLAYRLLTAEIARFRDQHPGIQVELTVDNRALDLSRREADVALRAARPNQPDLFGRRLADIKWAVYGSSEYIARIRKPTGLPDLAQHSFIGWGEAAQGINAARWLSKTVPREAIVYRTSSLVNQLIAVKGAIGLAVLPCYLADPEPGLERVLPPIGEITTELWLITHKALKDTARVRAFMEFVGDGIRRALPLLVRAETGAAAVSTRRSGPSSLGGGT
jgi:DNA-binding transcriptional LysR family regulator